MEVIIGVVGTIYLIVKLIYTIKSYFDGRKATFHSIDHIRFTDLILGSICIFFGLYRAITLLKPNGWYSQNREFFENISIVFIYILVGVILLLRSLTNEFINEYGIKTYMKNYGWDKIEYYEWGTSDYKKSKKKIVSYYNLKFNLKESKLKWFTKKQINVKIDARDKDLLDSFISNTMCN